MVGNQFFRNFVETFFKSRYNKNKDYSGKMSVNQVDFNPSENNLLICIRPDLILYSITDENNRILLRQEINILPFKTASPTFYEHFFNQPELSILSENVQILIENDYYQLIPNELFREENMVELFEMEFGRAENSRINFLLMPKWGIHVVYRVPRVMIEFFENKYPDAVIEHHISKLLKKKIEKTPDAVYACLRNNSLDVLVVGDSQLQLINSFDVGTYEDSCYFILSVYEQLRLSTESVTLYLISENAADERLIKVLNSYVVNLIVK